MIKKLKLETFIKKYFLNGCLEGAIWQNIDGNLNVNAVTNDKKLFTGVSLEKEAFFPTGTDIGVQETSRLKRLLSPLGEDVKLTLDVDEKDNTRVRQIIIEDKNLNVKYVTAQKDVITRDGKIPGMKNIPTFTVEIVLSPEFVDAYNKSVSALADDNTLFTLLMSKQKGKLELVLGYKQNLSDRVAFGNLNTVEGKDTVQKPISFSAKHLKEIFLANNESFEVEKPQTKEKEVVETPTPAQTPITLNVSEAGLANVSFSKDGFTSKYYLIQVNVED